MFIKFLSYKSSERNGIVILLIILVILIVLNIFPEAFRSNHLPKYNELVYEQVNEFYTSLKKENVAKASIKKETVELFYFDPNDISKAQWQKLGLSEKQAQIIINYKEKGGKFYTKSDVKKMYSISDDFFKTLEPYIRIKKHESQSSKLIQKDKIKKKESFDNTKPIDTLTQKSIVKKNINTVTAFELQKIKGIRKTMSYRIIKYRDLLGGFSSPELFKNVYGISDEEIRALSNNTTLNPNDINTINLNFCSRDDLKKHPLVSTALARKIVKFRSKNGAFTNVEQLLINDIVKPDQFLVLKYYFIVNP